MFVKGLKTGSDQAVHQTLDPDRLMSDSAWEIRNGFELTFPDKDLTNCYFHVSVNCHKKLKVHVKDEKDRARIKSDINFLQLCQNEEVFNKAGSLFIEKWENKYGNFTSYFKRQHLEQFPNWYEGKAMFSPSTNNALESRNGKIKQQWTNHKRLPMNEMMTLLTKMLKNWSLDLIQKPFVIKPIYTNDEIIEAYIYGKKDILIMADPEDDKVWWLPKCDSGKVTNRAIRNIKTLNWNSFNKFKDCNFELCKVSTHDPEDALNLIPTTCTCTRFYKDFKCNHALGVEIRLKQFVVSHELKSAAKTKVESTVPLPAKKRGPGRPKNAAPALMKQ